MNLQHTHTDINSSPGGRHYLYRLLHLGRKEETCHNTYHIHANDYSYHNHVQYYHNTPKLLYRQSLAVLCNIIKYAYSNPTLFSSVISSLHNKVRAAINCIRSHLDVTSLVSSFWILKTHLRHTRQH